MKHDRKTSEKDLLKILLSENPKRNYSRYFIEKIKSHPIISSISFTISVILMFSGFLANIYATPIPQYFGFAPKHKILYVTIKASQSYTGYSGVFLSKGRLIEVEIYHAGDEEIREEDYRKPITFRFSRDYVVRKVMLSNNASDDMGMQVFLNKSDVSLSETLINQGEKFIIKFCLDGENNDDIPFSVDTRIAGMSTPIEVSNDINQKYTQPEMICK